MNATVHFETNGLLEAVEKRYGMDDWEMTYINNTLLPPTWELLFTQQQDLQIKNLASESHQNPRYEKT